MSSNESIARQGFEFGLREASIRTFGKHFYSSILDIDYSLLKNKELTFHMTIPKSLCRKYRDKIYLAPSAILAMFDDLDSHSMVLKDKGHRAGVSINLNTEIYNHIIPDQNVVLKTVADKNGKLISFNTMELYSSSGELLARGKHIKYMSAGFLFDLMTHPMILPIFIWIFNVFIGSKITTIVDHLFDKRKEKVPQPQDDELANIFNELEVVKVKNVEDFPVLHNKYNVGYELYQMYVNKKTMTNFFGTMHGGAVATCIEEACMQSISAITINESDINLMLHDLDIRYFSPLSGEVIIQIEQDIASKKLVTTKHGSWHTHVIGALYTKKNPKVRAAEFTLTWKLL